MTLTEEQKTFFTELRNMLIKHHVKVDSFIDLTKDGQRFTVFFSSASDSLDIKFNTSHRLTLTDNGWR